MQAINFEQANTLYKAEVASDASVASDMSILYSVR